MPGQSYTKYLPYGFPGSMGQQGPWGVEVFPNAATLAINFGMPVFALNETAANGMGVTGAQGVAIAGATGLMPTAANFKGVAEAHVQQANSYNPQSMGNYLQYAPVPVVDLGGPVVQVYNSAVNPPVKDGPVYVRIANPAAGEIVGGFEALNDTTTYTPTITTQTTSSANITLAAVTNLAVGMTVIGTGIPASAIITAINATTGVITISAAATTTASSGTLTIGGNTLLITNATWGSGSDASGVALLILKVRNNS